MALTKQTKLARKRMNLIRSAQQRMFRQLRFTFTTSWCSTLYLGGGKRDHAPNQLLLFCSDLKFPLTRRSSWGLSWSPVETLHTPDSHAGWSFSETAAACLGRPHISNLTFHWQRAGPSQLVHLIKCLPGLSAHFFVRNPNRWRRNPVGKACECATASSSAD